MSSQKFIRASYWILLVDIACYSRIEKSVYEKHITPSASITRKPIHYVMNNGFFCIYKFQ